MHYLINSIKNCITLANVLFSKLYSHTKISVMTIATGWKEGKGLTAWHWRFYERIPWKSSLEKGRLYRESWGSLPANRGENPSGTRRTCGNWTRASPYYTDFRDRDAVPNGWSTPSDSIHLSPSARSQNRQGKWEMIHALSII